MIGLQESYASLNFFFSEFVLLGKSHTKKLSSVVLKNSLIEFFLFKLLDMVSYGKQSVSPVYHLFGHFQILEKLLSMAQFSGSI